MIGSVIQNGTCINVYDERGNTLCTKFVSSNGQLMGYTGSSFSVKDGSCVTVYDEKGNTLSTKFV